MSTKILVAYYSSTGNVHQIAQAVAAGAESTGAEVRLRRAPELAPDEAVAANPAWKAHLDRYSDFARVRLRCLLPEFCRGGADRRCWGIKWARS